MWAALIGVLLLSAVVCAFGWRHTTQRLTDRIRETVDLSNSSLVIEEERRMLELIAEGASLSEVLDTLTHAIERIAPGTLCTVMLLDEKERRHLLIASGPSLPDDYLQAINNLEIGPEVGACGSAAFRNETVVVEDIATDFRFAAARDFVLGHGLRACWSQPIRDSHNKVLGTFAMYHRHIAAPRSEELRMTCAAAQLAGNAIERIRAEQALIETTGRLRLAERVARFGIWEANFDQAVITISEGMAVMLELPPHKQQMTKEQFDALVHPGDLAALQAAADPEYNPVGSCQMEFRLLLPSGGVRWMRSHWNLESDSAGAGHNYGGGRKAIGAMIDITDEMNLLVQYQEAGAAAEASARAARQAESLEQDRKTILELVAKDKPLDEIVATMARAVASHLPDSLCSIRIDLNDGSRIAVYPGFPDSLAGALESMRIDSVRCTLASAPLADLSTDPCWKLYVKTLGYINTLRPNTAAASPFQYYRAVPILRENTPTGLIVSFFADHRTEQDEARLLDSWGQFASLAAERRGLYEQLSFRARYDSLTLLLNRASLYEHLDVQLSRPALKDQSLALIYIDLDRFKEINDCYGHGTGDKVLQYVSRHIRQSIRHTDIAARIGGDEFVLILPGVGDRKEARRIADLMLDAIGRPASFSGRELHVGASCGISLFPRDGTNSEALLKAADEDMYKEKIPNRHTRQEVLVHA
jgi:diguanylate cyclase (GGDEF)-like protein